MATYEGMIISKLKNQLDSGETDFNINYKLSYNPASNEVSCTIKNCEQAGDFANYVAEKLGEQYKVRFEFPNKI